MKITLVYWDPIQNMFVYVVSYFWNLLKNIVGNTIDLENKSYFRFLDGQANRICSVLRIIQSRALDKSLWGFSVNCIVGWTSLCCVLKLFWRWVHTAQWSSMYNVRCLYGYSVHPDIHCRGRPKSIIIYGAWHARSILHLCHMQPQPIRVQLRSHI